MFLDIFQKKRTIFVTDYARPRSAARTAAWMLCAATLWTVSSTQQVLGQSSWPSYPNNTAISVTSGGSVGIGVASPKQKLSVFGGIGFANQNDADKKLYSPIDGTLEWVTHNWAPEHGFAISHLGTRAVYLNTSGSSYLNGGNVGIGTSTPGAQLHIYSPSSANVQVQSAGSKSFARIWYITDHPTLWNVGARNDNGQLGGFSFESNGSGYWQSKLFITPAGNVGIGTITPQSKLAVNGTVTAREVVVTATGWADYVFQPDYRLRPLREVRDYIQSHRHLPDIPSEAEVKANGVSVGEMQAKLLAKIEELTLHLIQAEERHAHLQEQNQELHDRVRRLEAQR